jgi:hypothetical protein
VRFLLAGQLASRPRAGVLVEGPKVLLDQTLPSAPDGCWPHSQRCGNLLIVQAVISLQQDASAGELAGPSLPTP